MNPGFAIEVTRSQSRYPLPGRRTQYRWRAKTRNGKVIAASTETYYNMADLRDNLALVFNLDRDALTKYGVGFYRIEQTYDGHRFVGEFAGERGN